MLGQIHRCNVYFADDDYTTPRVTNLKVRFTHNTLNTQLQNLNQVDRTANLAGRRLQYPADWNMPDNARVEWINDPTAGANSLWNVEEETEAAWHGPNGSIIINTCQLVKINSVG